MKKLTSPFFTKQFKNDETSWKEAWSGYSFRFQLIFFFVLLIIVAALAPKFFAYIQSIPGYSINDLLLNEIQPQNLSLYIFVFIYSAILLSAIPIIVSPNLLLKFFQGYFLLLIVRTICIYLVPLEPEKSIILLEDPFVGSLFYDGTAITKDLFFSGHVSTMSLFAFIIPIRPLKYFLIILTILVAILILVQHVHYTIDVLAAPLFAWLCFWLVDRFSHHLHKLF